MDILRENFHDLRQRLYQQLIGQEALVDSLLLALLCNGHVLLEGYPGTAKTRAVKVLGRCINASMGRIQFTPDLLPADVTGAEVYHHDGEHQTLSFQPGPIFNNLVLADEINRAPAKVQSALLEAMQENQVTVAGQTYGLPDVFMVLATQNPIEQEGTYPLPEAQMDRFLLKTVLDYPDDAGELEIIRLVRAEEREETEVAELISQQQLLAARLDVSNCHVSEAIDQYIVALVMATRQPSRYPDSPLATWLALGASPRASIALDKCARAQAWLAGRDHVQPEDVQAVFENVISHRIYLSYQAQAESVSSADVAQEVLRQVAVA